MISSLRKIKRNIFDLLKFSLPKSNKESIFFFTFHKCASTLFSSYVLKNIDGLHQVDYAKHLWNKPVDLKNKLRFQKKGFVYGPIRLSAREQLVYNLLVLPASNLDFVKDITAIFFIRDPRDILVSSYYSFGFTHPLNPVEEKRNEQLELRKIIQSLSIDEYVLQYADQQVEYFNNLKIIASHCKKHVILRYEDMVEDFDSFINEFNTIGQISDGVVQNFYQKSRPKKSIDNESHKRSGETKRYLKDLKPETIKLLNKKLEQVLNDFKYVA